MRAFDRYGLAVTGWPISDEVTENNLKVQYFERMRMEYHPEFAMGTAVQLTRLGAVFAPQERLGRVAPFANTTTKLYFQQTGHSLSAPFLSYWRNNGSVEALGYPISEPLWENGLKVQWFERARLEHHPEMANSVWEVQLTRLGNMAYTQAGGSPNGQAGPEQRLLDSINSARIQSGVGAVAALPELIDLSQSRSSDMANRNYFSHNTPEGTDMFDMLRTRRIAFKYAGEIITKNTASDIPASTELAFQTFLNSPTHKDILLGKQFTHASAGYARTNSGVNYFTVVFIQK